MEHAADFFNTLGNKASDINTCILGKIEKFDALEMKAEVIPLYTNYPLLINIPVATIKSGDFFIKPSYTIGDLVVVIFADKDIDNILLGGNNENSTRTHALEDGIVIGGLTSFNERLDILDADVNDLVIGVNGKAYISMSSGGNIKIKGNRIDIEGTEGINITGPVNNESW